MNYEEIKKKLKDYNFKVTSQRDAIIKTFINNNDGYISAKNLKKQLFQDFGLDLSFDTIYKNLSLFESLGIITEKQLNKMSKYILNDKITNNDVFICLNCYKRIEIEDYCKHYELMKKYPDLMIKRHLLEIYGYCSDCKSVMQNKFDH